MFREKGSCIYKTINSGEVPVAVRSKFLSEPNCTVVVRKVVKITIFNMHVLQSVFRISLLFGFFIKVQGCSRKIDIDAKNTKFESLCDHVRTVKKPNQYVEPDHQSVGKNSPRLKTRDINCTFVIKAPEGYSIELVLRYSGDWVDVRDGRHQNTRVIGKYKDTVGLKTTVRSSGRYIRATFHSEALRYASSCSYAKYKVFRHQTKQDSVKASSKDIPGKKHVNRKDTIMLTVSLSWFVGILFALILGAAAGYVKKMKNRRNERERVQVPETDTAICGEVFAVEVELPNYDSRTNGPAPTEISSSASEVNTGPDGRDICANQSYFVYARNARDLVQELSSQQAAVVGASQVDGSANVPSDQQQYLVRVSHANNDIGPPPFYEGDNQDNSPPPLYEGDNQNNGPPPLYEGSNQDNRVTSSLRG